MGSDAGTRMLTSTGQYAIRAVAYLVDAQVRTEGKITAARIARATGMPKNYLTKILHTLAKARILESTRGPHGGFRLRVAPHRISLADVLASVETIGPSDCMLREGHCPHREPCPACRQCHALSLAVDRFLRKTSIADLTGGR